MSKKWRTIHIDELTKMTFEELAEEQIAAFLEQKEVNAGAAALFVNSQRRKMQNNKDIYMRELSKVYGRKCFCCGSEDRLVIDHIIPVSLGGCTTWENLQILCTPCNSSKRTKVVDYRRTARQQQASAHEGGGR